MRVLCLNNHYRDVIVHPDVTVIMDEDLGFYRRTFFGKLFSLMKHARQYDRIVFYRDHRLLFAYNLLSFNGLKRIMGGGKTLILHEFYMPEISAKPRLKLPYLYLVFQMCHTVIVHSREDIAYLSRLFHINAQKLKFIPYYYYGKIASGNHADTGCRYMIVPGRHRDLATLTQAVKHIDLSVVIVGGNDDKIMTDNPQTSCHWEVSREEYDRLFQEYSFVCIPLFKEKYKRSLGQIAILKAFANRKPLVIADTTWVKDYISSNVCLTYEPENMESLKYTIQKMLSMTEEERNRMTAKAAAFVAGYTKEAYADRFAQVMLE